MSRRSEAEVEKRTRIARPPAGSWAEQAGYLKLVLPLVRGTHALPAGGLQNTLPLGPAERSGTVGGWRKVGYRQEAGKARYLTVSDWGRTQTHTHTPP